MQVSIIIVNYNTRELTINCIESIYKYTEEIEFEIIVVDNASSDESILAITEKFPQVNIIEAGSNLGFGRANNLGVKNANGKFLFLLNSDTILIENSVKILIEEYSKLMSISKVGALGALLLDTNLNITGYGGTLPTIGRYVMNSWKKLIFSKEATNENALFQNSLAEVGMVSGADLFISKDIFVEIQGFDEKIFLYYEDTDLQKRLKDIGYCNFITNKTKIIHLEGGSSKLSNWKRIIIQSSQNYYYRKHYEKVYIVYILIQIPFIILSLANRKFSFKENFVFCKIHIKNFFKLKYDI